ncbi:MAG: hypothetical protein AAFQ37_09370 [Bacteroidota bacterium]
MVALLNLDIIPVILAAQVVNGFLLPFLAAVVIYLTNDQNLLGKAINKPWQNIAALIVFAFLAYQSTSKLSQLFFGSSFTELTIGIAFLVSGILLVSIINKRKRPAVNP